MSENDSICPAPTSFATWQPHGPVRVCQQAMLVLSQMVRAVAQAPDCSSHRYKPHRPQMQYTGATITRQCRVGLEGRVIDSRVEVDISRL
jgi:hypothetical protein